MLTTVPNPCAGLKGEKKKRWNLGASFRRASLEKNVQKCKFLLVKPPVVPENGKEKGSQVQIFVLKMHPLTK